MKLIVSTLLFAARSNRRVLRRCLLRTTVVRIKKGETEHDDLHLLPRYFDRINRYYNCNLFVYKTVDSATVLLNSCISFSLLFR